MKLLSALDHSPRLRSSTSGRALDPTGLAAIAVTIGACGIDAVDTGTLTELATRARARGVHPEVAGILTDESAPEVLRVRAFAHIHRLLTTARPTTGSTRAMVPAAAA